MNETEELRNLDAWIGLNVMGKHEFEPLGQSELCGVCKLAMRAHGHFNRQYIHVSKQLPAYTTDPAAAMQVLERCVGKSGSRISICQHLSGQFQVFTREDKIMRAETLPLAICLFAKLLYSEKG